MPLDAGAGVFLREVGIVVIGVLLALAAQQTVEWLDWRGKLAVAKRSVAGELADTRESAVERLRIYHCVDRRLGELARIVDAAAQAGRLPPIGLLGMPPNRGWTREAWTGVQSGDATNHLSAEDRATYGEIYSEIEALAKARDAEIPIWVELQQLSGPGRPFDPGDARAFRLAIGQARFTNRISALIGAQVLEDLRQSGLRLPPVAADNAASYGRRMADRPLCRPLARTGPATYGQAPWSDIESELILKPGDNGPPPAPPYPAAP